MDKDTKAKNSPIAHSVFFLLSFSALIGCRGTEPPGPPILKWYVFNERSGAFKHAAKRCSSSSGGAYRIETALLPANTDQQREQLVRRLAAGDDDIDIMGMDVIWTAEFAQAGWILPWTADLADQARRGRLAATVKSATYNGQLWAAPFTTNTQLLWYRTDRVKTPPSTWEAVIRAADAIGPGGTIEVQGERYEGLTVFFTSLLASAGGAVLSDDGRTVSLEYAPTHAALTVMKDVATSPAAPPSLSTTREDEARLAFEAGKAAFMVNYTYVWPSAWHDVPKVAKQMGWARWPAVVSDKPSRVTIGGINLGISAYSRRPDLAFRAAACIAGEDNQRLAARLGGLPPTISALYDTPEIRKVFPFADTLRATLKDAVQRPQTPVYSDISLAISHTLHPMRDIQPDRDVARLRRVVERALHSEGLL